jgi:hypothetical protein
MMKAAPRERDQSARLAFEARRFQLSDKINFLTRARMQSSTREH